MLCDKHKEAPARKVDPKPSISEDTLSDWLDTAEEALRGEPTDWHSALRSLRGSFLWALGRPEITEN